MSYSPATPKIYLGHVLGGRERERESLGSFKLQLKLSALGCDPARNLVSWLQNSHHSSFDFVNTTGHLNRQQHPPDINPDSIPSSPCIPTFLVPVVSFTLHPQYSRHWHVFAAVPSYIRPATSDSLRPLVQQQVIPLWLLFSKVQPVGQGRAVGRHDGHKSSAKSPEKAAADYGRLRGYTMLHRYTLKNGTRMITFLVASVMVHVESWGQSHASMCRAYPWHPMTMHVTSPYHSHWSFAKCGGNLPEL